MSVLVDTSVWSLALRRSRPAPGQVVAELARLVKLGDAVMMAPVRQEILSGVKDATQFKALRERLRAFPDLALDTGDFEEAARCFNRCRSRGIQGSNTDFLICAVAVRRGLAVFTTDADFTEFSRVLSLTLHQAAS